MEEVRGERRSTGRALKKGGDGTIGVGGWGDGRGERCESEEGSKEGGDGTIGVGGWGDTLQKSQTYMPTRRIHIIFVCPPLPPLLVRRWGGGGIAYTRPTQGRNAWSSCNNEGVKNINCNVELFLCEKCTKSYYKLLRILEINVKLCFKIFLDLLQRDQIRYRNS
jgi:hypothetical protein